MKKIAIIIPAYNEENNISNILKDIFKQKEKNFVIHQIIVLNDGSTDKTVQKVNSIKDKRIRLISGTDRKGKTFRMNEVFKILKEDILVQFDADIRLIDNNTLYNLVEVFNKNPKIDIVFGNQQPLKPKTYIEELAYFGFYAWEDAKTSLGPTANRYRVHGQIRAYSRKFYSDYQVTDVHAITEDTYSFYYAMQHKKNVYFQHKSIAYFRLASTFRDYVKQMSRFISINSYIKSRFGKKLYEKYEVISTWIKLKHMFLRAIKTPLKISLGYVLLHIFTRMYVLFFKAKPVWDISLSTKLLTSHNKVI